MRRWLPAVLIAGAVLFSLAVYSRLPDQVPVHWGSSGEANRYGTRIEGAFLMPALMITLLVIMRWYPSRDPRSANIAKFRDAYDTVVTGTIALLTGIHVLALGDALGWQVDMARAVMISIGVLFILVGNLLPVVRSNFILGIRTPWTLSSETVWTRSHRVGGYAMVGADRTRELLALVGLEHAATRPARRLSGGEQQRLALARALARDPAILFLDEPTASLDPASTKAIEDVIRTVSQRGIKVVMSTHDLGEARRLAGEVVLLHRGRLVEAAAASRFFDAPQTREARTFIAGELLV